MPHSPIPTPGSSISAWWASAVVYQIYPRSFADANGDGMGDLAGITAKLPYLEELGVDAVWLSPFYKSPQADAGYDVADYRAVDPLFGTLDDFDTMLEKAHSLGIKVIVDLVPNHTSDEHAWFREALAAAPGSPARERYMFHPGKDSKPGSGDGALVPNNWKSVFGGPAWTRLTNDDGTPGQWYLHLFDTKQPDLNWENPEVHEEMRSVLRFWLDRGVDGFRVDVAHGLVKEAGLPDWEGAAAMIEGGSAAPGVHSEAVEPHTAKPHAIAGTAPAKPAPGSVATAVEHTAVEHKVKPPLDPPSPYFDQDGIHEIYRDWHKVLSEYDGDRMLVAEAWVEPAERLARYIRRDEMQQAFNFDFLLAGWDAERMAEAIESSLDAAGSVEAPSTWVLSNHDTVRHPSRFGLADPTTFPKGIAAEDEQPDAELGLARARAASMVSFALPGSAYLYQGEELGLPEHTSLPAEARQDPSFFRTKGVERGRDGCRVPLPWKSSEPGFGFSEASSAGAGGADAAGPGAAGAGAAGPGAAGPGADGPGADGPGAVTGVKAPAATAGKAPAATGVKAPAATVVKAPAAPWLPQPEAFGELAADLQAGVGGSTLELYRSVLALRRAHRLGSGTFQWAEEHDPANGVLAFRNRDVLVVINMAAKALPIPAGLHVELSSDGGSGNDAIAPDSAAYLVSQ